MAMKKLVFIIMIVCSVIIERQALETRMLNNVLSVRNPYKVFRLSHQLNQINKKNNNNHKNYDANDIHQASEIVKQMMSMMLKNQVAANTEAALKDAEMIEVTQDGLKNYDSSSRSFPNLEPLEFKSHLSNNEKGALKNPLFMFHRFG